MKKIGKISISYLALVAVIAFNFLAIHHHHHEMAVPIIVELLGSNGDDADSDASHTCHHPGVQKCSYHQAALRNVVFSMRFRNLTICSRIWRQNILNCRSMTHLIESSPSV